MHTSSYRSPVHVVNPCHKAYAEGYCNHVGDFVRPQAVRHNPIDILEMMFEHQWGEPKRAPSLISFNMTLCVTVSLQLFHNLAVEATAAVPCVRVLIAVL